MPQLAQRLYLLLGARLQYVCMATAIAVANFFLQCVLLIGTVLERKS